MAVNTRTMSNVSIAAESALGTAKPITLMTKAAPGVFTSVAHGFVNGDFIALDTPSVQVLNNRVFRVAAIAADTFQLEDISSGVGLSTIGFETLSSGSAQKITFGNSISSAAGIEITGGEFDFIDTTLIHGNQKTQMPGATNPVEIKLIHLWDLTDSGQLALKSFSDLKQAKAFKMTFGIGGPVMAFIGYTGFTAVPIGTSQDRITSPSTMTLVAAPVLYSA